MAAHATAVDGASGGDSSPETTGEAKAVWLRYHGFRARFWQALYPPLRGTAAELRRNWQRLEPWQMLCCVGQLAEVRQRDGHLDYWVSAEAHAHATTYPVALGFLVPKRLEQLFPSLEAPQVQSPYPPPTLGEMVVVLDGPHYREHEIAECGAEAVAIQQRLEEALRFLLQDTGGEVSLYMLLAALPQVAADQQARLFREQESLRRSWSDWVADVLAGQWTPDPARAKLLQKIGGDLRLLETAQQHLARLNNPPTEQERQAQEQQWAEIRFLARQLAVAAYRALHPALPHVSPTSGPVVQAVTRPEEWLAGQPLRGPILADPVSCALLRLWDESIWTLDATSSQARAPLPLDLPVGSAELELQLGQERGDWATTPAWREQWNDHLIDTWLAVQMLLLACNPDDPTTPLELSPKLILETCWREKTSYGYPRQQRQRVQQDLELLARLQVRIHFLKAQGAAVPPIESPLLAVQQEEEQWHVALGDWVRLLPAQWRTTTTISRRLLQLHPNDERYAKRLGRQVSYLFRQQREVRLSVERITKELGMPPDPEHPKRSRDVLMRAIKVLADLPVLPKTQRQRHDEPMVWKWRSDQTQTDGTHQIIGAFAAQRLIEVEQVQRGFWEQWRRVEWQFSPPSHLLDL